MTEPANPDSVILRQLASGQECEVSLTFSPTVLGLQVGPQFHASLVPQVCALARQGGNSRARKVGQVKPKTDQYGNEFYLRGSRLGSSGKPKRKMGLGRVLQKTALRK